MARDFWCTILRKSGSFAGTVLMVTKGAETAILNRVKTGPHNVTSEHVDYYATVGETLCVLRIKFGIIYSMLWLKYNFDEFCRTQVRADCYY